jgi:predicted N-acetyltransferase YhbS
MKILITRTLQKDFPVTEFITREAFWNLYKPGCDEHLILHKIRNSKCYIPELDLVAVFENEIIGHIISTKAKIVDSSKLEHEVLCVGPLSVLRDFQNKGIGSILINNSIAIAKESGYCGMILFGNPDYYHRFGFVNAQKFNITTKDSQNFEPFMALELQNNGFEKKEGRFFEDNAFEILQDDLIEFEKSFPYKEKLITDTQLKH